MKNREKYADEIIDATIDGICPKMREIAGIICIDKTEDDCKECERKYAAWLEAEYVEPSIDWRKVKVDTPILVSIDGEDWEKRHFAKYEDGTVQAWHDGKTSFTTATSLKWTYAKLVEENK